MSMRNAVRFSDWALMALVLWVALTLTPLSWWGFVPAEQVYVADTTTEEAAAVGFERTIWRPVKMHYSVTVRRVEGYQVACEALSGTKRYSPESTIPEDADLVWWAPQDGRCGRLFPPGAYVMETCWFAEHLLFGILPAKTRCVPSNVFHVRDASGPHA